MHHIPTLTDYHNIWNDEMLYRVKLQCLFYLPVGDVQFYYLQALYTFQIWKCPQSLFQSCPCCYSQGISHLQPFYLRHDSLQIQVSAVTQLIGNLSMKKSFYWEVVIFQQGHFSRKGSMSTLPSPGPQEGLHNSVTQWVFLHGLNAEQTVITLQNQVSQSFLHVYDRHSEFDICIKLIRVETNIGQTAPSITCSHKSDAHSVLGPFK